MRYKINVVGGGIFSKYMTVVQNLLKKDFDGGYINITDNRTDSDMFNNIFDQEYGNYSNVVNCNTISSYNNFNKIEFSESLNSYKLISDKFVLKEKILQKLNYYEKNLNITENSVGVHIRLTDMNMHHSEYGISNFNDYLNALINLNNSKNIDNFFVASDNEESLTKLVDVFGDKIKYIPNLIRGKHENEDTLKLQLDNFRNKDFWEESFIDMLLLSKCSYLVCRTSNLNNASIIYSKTLKNIVRV